MATTKPRTRKSAPKPSYTGTVLVRVYNRATGEVLGYAAKPSQPTNPDGTVKTWYQITCDAHGCWHCTCDGNAKGHRQCCHIEAAMELCEIRVKAGRPGCYAPVVVAPLPASPEVAALVAVAAAIPSSPKPDRAAAVLQPRGFALPPSWEELAAQHQIAS